MKEFILAALPLVLMGLALAVLAASHMAEKQGAHIATGAGLGLILGMALNGCGLWESHLPGLALGPLLGICLFRGGKSNEQI